jgi:hypothetical protein
MVMMVPCDDLPDGCQEGENIKSGSVWARRARGGSGLALLLEQSRAGYAPLWGIMQGGQIQQRSGQFGGATARSPVRKGGGLPPNLHAARHRPRAISAPCVCRFTTRKAAQLDLALTRNRLLFGSLGLESLGVCRACCRHLRALILLGLFLLAVTFLLFAHSRFPRPWSRALYHGSALPGAPRISALGQKRKKARRPGQSPQA